MSNYAPLVSIGIPTYNRATYLKQALDSLLAQDYPNLEIIISDNASTDETEVICRAYVRSDSRIRYFRNSANLGPIRNFQRVLSLASGPYFMWAADDDLWEQTFVSSIVERLVNTPDTVLGFCYYDSFNYMTGQRSQIHKISLPSFGKLYENCKAILLAGHVDMVYGIYRIDILRQTIVSKMKDSFDYGDLAWLIEISTMGQICIVPKLLYHAGCVYEVPPVKSCAKTRLPGFKYAYWQYYSTVARCLWRAKTFNFIQTLSLNVLLIAQVFALVRHNEEVIPSQIKRLTSPLVHTIKYLYMRNTDSRKYNS